MISSNFPAATFHPLSELAASPDKCSSRYRCRKNIQVTSPSEDRILTSSASSCTAFRSAILRSDFFASVMVVRGNLVLDGMLLGGREADLDPFMTAGVGVDRFGNVVRIGHV